MLNQTLVRFSAGYDTTAKVISLSVFTTLLAVVVLSHNAFVAALSVLLVIGFYAYSPRAYAVSSQSIIIKRLIGDVQVPLANIDQLRVANSDDFEG